MRNFFELYNLKNLINEPTCYKDTATPSSIDVMLISKKGSFQTSKMTISVLKRYVKKAPLIKKLWNYGKVIKGNNPPFMNKNLSKAFMHRSKLENKFNKYPTEINKELHKKQKNYCVNLDNL